MKKKNPFRKEQKKVMTEALKTAISTLDMLDEFLSHPIRKKEFLVKTLKELRDTCQKAVDYE